MICAEVYLGQNTQQQRGGPGSEMLSKSEVIVVHLLAKGNLLDQGYEVTLDNWYTSVRLAQYLWLRKTAMRGTINPVRGIPQVLRDKRLPKSDSAYMRKEHLLAVKFHDKKDVYLLSTADSAGGIEKTRHLTGNQIQVYQKPQAIETYNLRMGGVDITDQLIAGVNSTRKSHVWFKKIGIHYIQRLVLNAYLLHKRERDPKMSFHTFMQRSIVQLTGKKSRF
jgi:hypothetical protein